VYNQVQSLIKILTVNLKC